MIRISVDDFIHWISLGVEERCDDLLYLLKDFMHDCMPYMCKLNIFHAWLYALESWLMNIVVAKLAKDVEFLDWLAALFYPWWAEQAVGDMNNLKEFICKRLTIALSY